MRKQKTEVPVAAKMSALSFTTSASGGQGRRPKKAARRRVMPPERTSMEWMRWG